MFRTCNSCVPSRNDPLSSIFQAFRPNYDEIFIGFVGTHPDQPTCSDCLLPQRTSSPEGEPIYSACRWAVFAIRNTYLSPDGYIQFGRVSTHVDDPQFPELLARIRSLMTASIFGALQHMRPSEEFDNQTIAALEYEKCVRVRFTIGSERSAIADRTIEVETGGNGKYLSDPYSQQPRNIGRFAPHADLPFVVEIHFGTGLVTIRLRKTDDGGDVVIFIDAKNRNLLPPQILT